MYALQDAGSTVTTVANTHATIGPTPQQLDRRAIEPTQRTDLETEDRPDVHYDSTRAVLQLVEGSAQNLAAMLESDFDEPAQDIPEAVLGEGRYVDVYA